MNLIDTLKSINAEIVTNDGIQEVYFKEKTDFIKHRLALNNFNLDFDEQKNCFLLKNLDEEKASKLANILENRPTIIFDMDGVIVNTTNSFSVVTIKTYNHFTGKELTSKEINEIKYQGGFNSDWDILMHLFEKDGISVNFDDMAKFYMDLYFDGKGGYIDKELLILKEEYIQELLKSNHLAIFTGRDTKSAMYTLHRWNLEKYFYPIITFEWVGENHQKPDIKGVNIIKEKVIANDFYYLGDTVDDMICARNSKVNGIGVLPPRDKSEKLKSRLLEEGAITCLQTTTDVVDFLGKKLIPIA